MTTLPRIDITDDHALMEACYVLYGNSALDFACRVVTDAGRVYLQAERPVPMLSSGEQILWEALCVLEAGSILTPDDMRAADAGLDQRSRDALRRAANEYALAVSA